MKEKKTIEVFKIENRTGTFFDINDLNGRIIEPFFNSISHEIELEIKTIDYESATLKQFLLFVFFVIPKDMKESDENFFFELEQKLLRFMIFINLNHLISNIFLSLKKIYVPFMWDEDNRINIQKFFSKDKDKINKNKK